MSTADGSLVTVFESEAVEKPSIHKKIHCETLLVSRGISTISAPKLLYSFHYRDVETVFNFTNAEDPPLKAYAQSFKGFKEKIARSNLLSDGDV